MIEIEAMKTPDGSRIDRILAQIEKIQAADPKGASTAATALRAKIGGKKELWKKYGRQIEFCIEQ